MTDEERRAMALDFATREAAGKTAAFLLARAKVYAEYIKTGDY